MMAMIKIFLFFLQHASILPLWVAVAAFDCMSVQTIELGIRLLHDGDNKSIFL